MKGQELQHLKHSEINKDKWDYNILNSSQEIIYAYSWFLDIVSPEWEALVIGDYELVFPLCKRRKYGFTYLFQPCFNQQLGFFSINPVTPNEEKQILNYIAKKYGYIDINI